MAIDTLRGLYAAELRGLMHAERQILEELRTISGRASSALLRRTLDDHRADTRAHVDRLGLLIEQLNEPPESVPGGAVAALIEDASRRILGLERGELLDAALIAAALRIAHYEIASYMTARRYAEELGEVEAAQVLQQTLDDEEHIDQLLRKLALHGVDQSGKENLPEGSAQGPSRLRYVAASDLPGAREEGGLQLHNRAGTHLGSLDGFITERPSGRPIYCVIDPREWFSERRYVVPVGRIEADEAGASLITTLTRHALCGYPEFSSSAFAAMDDNDALMYERCLHRVFAPTARSYAGRPVYENLPIYRAPTWLITGLWMGNAVGIGDAQRRENAGPNHARPVSATSETAEPEQTASSVKTRLPRDEPFPPESRLPIAETDLMTASGEPACREERRHVPDSGDVNPRSTEEPKTIEPRIERYRDR